MPKNIAFFADGTWDDPNDNSNVAQLFAAAENLDGIQLTAYDSGLGANGSEIDKWLGGGIGAGIFQKIKDGYSAISVDYLPGDRLFLFGFSRGAYTVRSLAGMIAICGLPTVNQSDPQCVDTAFEAYRNPAQRQSLLDSLNQDYRMDSPTIQFLGVWDTVGSLGIPAIFGGIDVCQFGFLDTSLHPDILNAVQALAVDEKRLQFQPAIWDSPPAPGQSLTQIWFSGVHCDVGGGYPADPGGFALSNIPLLWMANHARDCGLLLKPDAFSHPFELADSLATLHNSLTGLYRLTPHQRNIVTNSSIAESVQSRCATPTANYAPGNLHTFSGKLAENYSIVVVP